MSVAFALELAASVSTILQIWLYGNKTLGGPIWGLVAVTAWWVLTCWSGLWGLAPLNAVASVVHARNFIKWWREGL